MILKRIFFILVWAAVNLHLGSQLLRQWRGARLENFPLSVKVFKEPCPVKVWILDMEGDGEDEVVMIYPSSLPDRTELSVVKPAKESFDFTPLVEKILIPEGCVFSHAHFDKKSGCYLFRFIGVREGSIHLLEIDSRRKDVRREVEFADMKMKEAAKSLGSVNPFFIDLDEDDKEELVVAFCQGYDRYPKGVVCFDPRTGALLWEYYAGASIHDLEFKDLDGDNRREIIMSSTATNNGAEMNGTSDAYSYVIVLDSSGKETWKQKTGSWYSSVQISVSDLDSDGRFEIVAATECHRAHTRAKGEILIFDALTGKEKARYISSDASFFKPVIVQRDKQESRIYVSDYLGRIRMFDSKLQLLKTIDEKTRIGIINIPIQYKGREYILAMTGQKLMAYDRDLQEKVFCFSFFQPEEIIYLNTLLSPFFVPLKTHPGEHYLLLADRMYLVSLAEVNLSRILKNLVKSGVFYSLILLLLCNGFFIRVSKGFIFKQNQRKALTDSIQALETIQGIAQQTRPPISGILWTAEKMKQDLKLIESKQVMEDYDQLADFLMEDAESLRRNTNRTLKLIQVREPKFVQVELKPLFESLVNHYSTLLGGKIDIKLEVEKDLLLKIDEELFKEALVNLLDNAVDAMPHRGKLRISAISITSPQKGTAKEVLIEIEDTGAGMDEKEISQVFEPFFTKKEKGSGIGLTICKKIIEAHSGTVEFHSKKDFGTRVSITLPAKN